MFTFGRVLALSLTLLDVAHAAPNLLPLAFVDGPARPGGYIVQLKVAALARRSLSSAHRTLLQSFSPSESQIKYEWPALNAFSGTFSDAALLALRSSSEVAAIEHDALGGADGFVTQTDAPWGLRRISQLPKVNSTDYRALNYTYVYDSTAGQGVDIYIIDSGINVDHEDFEGRARWGTAFNGLSELDEYGHGTHVAGIAAGKTFGVAKKANPVAVRILDKNGAATTSDAIAAVDWVVKEVATKAHVPSIINMSLRFPPSIMLDNIVNTAVKAGVHTVVSAGNAATLSDTQSPARAEAAITVGATDISDNVAYFSNYGPGVDIFAPGQQIASALNNDNTWYTLKSGTSQASPHVAGLVAYVIALEGDKTTSEILARIKDWSPDNILSEMPADTNNEIANNGVSA
ncbi:peptidase 1 [Auricularia subglabra TFB-10046 SS5]|nr:peptidase 1 [Auricularia subglabra TFB-10046 SS5]